MTVHLSHVARLGRPLPEADDENLFAAAEWTLPARQVAGLALLFVAAALLLSAFG